MKGRGNLNLVKCLAGTIPFLGLELLPEASGTNTLSHISEFYLTNPEIRFY